MAETPETPEKPVKHNDTGAKSRSAQKSDQAFRTISEVADELDLPQHVLRFWETKFNQISPMKRGGGRRYYRPEDVELLRTIKALLHYDGYTIKGVQKLLSAGGVKNLPTTNTAAHAGDSSHHDLQTPSKHEEAAQTPVLSDTEHGLDATKLAVLVRELEEIRDHLKKTAS
ncbi:MerR family transcriptional regulator [Magnetovibrio sp.]|uniref:MerR family transcriptional regulator n=1 Tax=Magnetovibrio sp. TaxID=2024836 RepID=UPI002F949EC0